ncbi:hypothetical protein LCGC14_0674650 [marine sediment metagenome]|uniref:Uncharacterized protein n=1 Tax=marine sediment metagenome TaxID=412755 RepID=A0A0F9TXV6_9ZZZZ
MDAIEKWNEAMVRANANHEARVKDAQRLLAEAKEIYDNDLRHIQEDWNKSK